MNELKINEINTVMIKPAEIIFPQYDELKQQAQQVYEYLSTVEVTEDTVKASKKLVATVNKSAKALEDERIRIKKMILEPYTGFESQIKEIVGIVKDADKLVRDQIKELEQIERDNKEAEIKELFEKRIQAYDFADLFGFEDFLKPQYLNKTVTITKVETELVDWLEAIESDFEVIQSMNNGKEVMAEYRNCKNLATAIRTVNDRKAVINTVQTVMEVEEYGIKVFSKKDLKLVEMLLKENEIEYKLI